MPPKLPERPVPLGEEPTGEPVPPMIPEPLPGRPGDGTPPSEPDRPRSCVSEVSSFSFIPEPVPPASVSLRVMLVPLAPVVSTRPINPPESLVPRSTWSRPLPEDPAPIISPLSCSTWSALNISRGPSRNSRSRPSRAYCLISSSDLPRAALASSSV